ncbi:DNA alkylation repair protein [Prescottella agglutinans]|uniref:3-methyladenine DNA glycosylase AlkD n=1 Tax=Prescottella agglutinans TaxID=1644129 RepID=A0ABT6M997_9NOCA|nr:DNA alkylation repair protein [Prescottella agglutinans]MDH6280886.1 3-methyladenine DNA glycosylase AlkD [Prescottella agglutinans]
MPDAGDVIAALTQVADADDARQLQRFFKTGPGEYGEGDVFIGVRVPAVRTVAKRFASLPLDDVDTLLDSAVHEQRLTGLLVLVEQFARASRARGHDDEARERIAERYLAAVLRGRVNNWDLVDLSALHILGGWFYDRPRDPVFTLGADEDLWRRRVALLTTFGFIRRGDASTTLELAARVLGDRRDLTQKATGWMLREVGKRVDRGLLLGFLDRHAAEMGATALSYATEHLDADARAHYRLLRSS